MNEYVVYVDENGKPTGETAEKFSAHHAHTKLHLAFSCYVFDEHNQLLATQRAYSKKVWPGVWTNSVCGHPAPTESMEDAIARRLQFELGMKVSDLTLVLPNYRYTTPPFNGIIENEFCPVFVARKATKPNPNPEEVVACKWMKWDDFTTTAQADSADVWSWWCKDQLVLLNQNKEFKAFIAED